MVAGPAGMGGDGGRQDLSQELGSLTLVMMKQIKTKIHPLHPNASARKGERETSKGNVTMTVFCMLFNDNFSC